MNALILKVRQWHGQFFGLVSYLQSPFLLLVRLYWGWQLAQSGWGKLHHLSNVGEYFATLGLPMPAPNGCLHCLRRVFRRHLSSLLAWPPGSRAWYSP